MLTQRHDPGPRWAPLTARNYRVALSSLFGWPAVLTIPRQLEHELIGWRDTIAAHGHEPAGDLHVALALRFPSGTHAATATPSLLPTPIGWNGLARIVHNRGLLIGIAGLRPHDLRRTLAGLLDSDGARLQDIRLVLPHDRLATTEAYVADYPRRVERRMRRLTLPVIDAALRHPPRSS